MTPLNILNEAVFRTAIARERKRADRFGQPVLLFRIALDRELSADGWAKWDRVIEALSAAKRRSDVLGWCKSRAVLGLLVPEIQLSNAGASLELLRRFRRELEKRLAHNVFRRLSIRIDVHPSPAIVGADAEFGSDRRWIETGDRARHDGFSRLYPPVKRASDVVGSLTLLLVFLPILLIIAVLVKMNSCGPVLFRQERVGHKGKPFTLLKFRTMHTNADHRLHQNYVSWFIKGGRSATTDAAPFKIYNDPRVTRVGAVLRQASLDELPQLWNVLRGDMSLVGPRPPIGYEVEQYEPWHRRRVMEVKPGLTGLWQVAGRSRTTFDQMVRLDLQYAKTCSLWSDIKILFATPAAMISGKGAR